MAQHGVIKTSRLKNSVYNTYGNGVQHQGPKRFRINFTNDCDFDICNDFINFHGKTDKNQDVIIKPEVDNNSMIFDKTFLNQQKLMRFWESSASIKKQMPEFTRQFFSDIDELIHSLDPEKFKNLIKNWSAEFFASAAIDKKGKNITEISAYLNQLKEYIEQGLLDRMSINEIFTRWKNSPAIFKNKTIEQLILDSEDGKEILEQIDAIVEKHENNYWFKPFF